MSVRTQNVIFRHCVLFCDWSQYLHSILATEQKKSCSFSIYLNSLFTFTLRHNRCASSILSHSLDDGATRRSVDSHNFFFPFRSFSIRVFTTFVCSRFDACVCVCMCDARIVWIRGKRKRIKSQAIFFLYIPKLHWSRVVLYMWRQKRKKNHHNHRHWSVCRNRFYEIASGNVFCLAFSLWREKEIKWLRMNSALKKQRSKSKWFCKSKLRARCKTHNGNMSWNYKFYTRILC